MTQAPEPVSSGGLNEVKYVAQGIQQMLISYTVLPRVQRA